jgi:hypothetical protein
MALRLGGRGMVSGWGLAGVWLGRMGFGERYVRGDKSWNSFGWSLF